MRRTTESILRQALACWNWKCALLSATARSLVYLAALARTKSHGHLSIVVVEIAYVSLTAGTYAGMQQRALALRSRMLGNFCIACAVPALSQAMDWLAHRAAGAAVSVRVTASVWVFSAVSALFHLHAMRRGAFVTGKASQTLVHDLVSIPRLVAGFIVRPFRFIAKAAERVPSAARSEVAG